MKKLFARAAASLSGRYRTMSIQMVISLSFTAAAVAGMVLMGLSLVWRYSAGTEQLVRENTERVLAQVNMNMDSYLRRMMRVSDTMYYRIIKNADLATQSLDEGMELLYEENRDELVSIAVFDSRGALVAGTPLTALKEGADPASSDWYQAALDKMENLHFSTPHIQRLFAAHQALHRYRQRDVGKGHFFLQALHGRQRCAGVKSAGADRPGVVADLGARAQHPGALLAHGAQVPAQLFQARHAHLLQAQFLLERGNALFQPARKPPQRIGVGGGRGFLYAHVEAAQHLGVVNDQSVLLGELAVIVFGTAAAFGNALPVVKTDLAGGNAQPFCKFQNLHAGSSFCAGRRMGRGSPSPGSCCFTIAKGAGFLQLVFQ